MTATRVFKGREFSASEIGLITEVVASYQAAMATVERDEAAYRETLRRQVLEHAQEVHDYKYWDAATSIADRLEGATRVRWLAAMMAAPVMRRVPHRNVGRTG